MSGVPFGIPGIAGHKSMLWLLVQPAVLGAASSLHAGSVRVARHPTQLLSRLVQVAQQQLLCRNSKNAPACTSSMVDPVSSTVSRCLLRSLVRLEGFGVYVL
jgi:hypothetical protein